MATSISTFRSDLVDFMKALDALDGVKVAHGQPPEPPRELVWLGELRSADAELHGFGSQRRTESYEIEVNFMSIKSNDNPSRAEERAVALGDAVAEALQADPKAGSTAVKGAYVNGYELGTYAHDRGWLSIYTLTIDVLARTTTS